MFSNTRKETRPRPPSADLIIRTRSQKAREAAENPPTTFAPVEHKTARKGKRARDEEAASTSLPKKQTGSKAKKMKIAESALLTPAEFHPQPPEPPTYQEATADNTPGSQAASKLSLLRLKLLQLRLQKRLLQQHKNKQLLKATAEDTLSASSSAKKSKRGKSQSASFQSAGSSSHGVTLTQLLARRIAPQTKHPAKEKKRSVVRKEQQAWVSSTGINTLTSADIVSRLEALKTLAAVANVSDFSSEIDKIITLLEAKKYYDAWKILEDYLHNDDTDEKSEDPKFESLQNTESHIICHLYIILINLKCLQYKINKSREEAGQFVPKTYKGLTPEQTAELEKNGYGELMHTMQVVREKAIDLPDALDRIYSKLTRIEDVTAWKYFLDSLHSMRCNTQLAPIIQEIKFMLLRNNGAGEYVDHGIREILKNVDNPRGLTLEPAHNMRTVTARTHPDLIVASLVHDINCPRDKTPIVRVIDACFRKFEIPSLAHKRKAAILLECAKRLCLEYSKGKAAHQVICVYRSEMLQIYSAEFIPTADELYASLSPALPSDVRATSTATDKNGKDEKDAKSPPRVDPKAEEEVSELEDDDNYGSPAQNASAFFSSSFDSAAPNTPRAQEFLPSDQPNTTLTP